VGGGVGAEWSDGHLLRIDARFRQDDPQQVDVGIAKPDDADAASAESRDLRDLRPCGALAARRRPQHHKIPAQDRDRIGIGGHVGIAPPPPKGGRPRPRAVWALPPPPRPPRGTPPRPPPRPHLPAPARAQPPPLPP